MTVSWRPSWQETDGNGSGCTSQTRRASLTSTHPCPQGETAAVAACAAHADYLSIGPIFSTYAKSNAGPAIGTHLLTELARRYQTPIIGIGGITAKNAKEVLQAGAVGVAVITAVISAEDVAAATRELAFQIWS